MTAQQPSGRRPSGWINIARFAHAQLREHAAQCDLCLRGCEGLRDDQLTAGAADVLVSTACGQGVLLFSEWLTAVNHSLARTSSSRNAELLFETVLSEAR